VLKKEYKLREDEIPKTEDEIQYPKAYQSFVEDCIANEAG
jgi:hypothetical protein